MKKVMFALVASVMLVACGGNGTSTEGTNTDSTAVDTSAVMVDTTAVEAADSTEVVK